MAIVRWDPFRSLEQVFDDDFPSVSRLIPRGSNPLAVDVYDEGKNVIAEMHLPGIDPEKLDVIVEDSILRITGSREEVREEDNKKKNYYYKEIQRGSFERTIQLPTDVKGSQATASVENGILKVTIPKREESNKKIKVEVKKK